MFKYVLDFTNLIHVSKITVNDFKKKITYFFDGRIETRTFADQSEFDEAVDEIVETGFLLIGETYYNKDRLSIVIPNGVDCTFMFIGNVIINHTYADVSEVEDVIAEIEPQFIEINGKWYQGKQIHVAKTNNITLTISYDYLGMDWFDVTYPDQAAYDEAIEKLANIGEGGGSGTKKVKTPVLSPRGGNVEAGTEVTITCATEGATIHYTTDGSTPDETSATYSGPITVNTSMTIKAMAVKTDMKNSSVASGTYTIAMPTCANVTFNPAPGGVLSGTEVTLSCATDGATIYYTTDGSTPDETSTVYSTPIEITAATTIKAIAKKEGYLDSGVGTGAYTIDTPTVATPTFVPDGGNITSGDTVTMSCSTDGATIYYTTDGSTPTSSSTEYTAPVVLNATTTVKAIAVKTGYNDSAVKSATFTVPEYYYAGVYNNLGEEPEDDHMADPITLEVLENLANVDKQVATQKEYGSAGHEHVFSGFSDDFGGRVVYAYPKHLGALTNYITNGITGPIETSFEVATVMIGSVEYYVYYLRPCTFNPIANYAFY